MITAANGRDLLHPDVLVQPGETIRVEPGDRYADALQAAAVPGEAADELVNAWPCRLFLVSGSPVSEAREPDRYRFFELNVVAERPAAEMFGPYGQEVVRTLWALERLHPRAIAKLSELEADERAQERAQELAVVARRRGAVALADHAARNAVRRTLPVSKPELRGIWRRAAEASARAITASVLGDYLPRPLRRTLFDQWARAATL